MAAGAPQLFTVTQAQFDALVAKANASGVPLSGSPTGRAGKDGVTLDWSYDGATLTLTVESRAWYDPSVADIEAGVASMVNGVISG
jgi:hypothetical protein